MDLHFQEEKAVREDVDFGDLPIDKKEVDRAVHTQKWDRAKKENEAFLEG